MVKVNKTGFVRKKRRQKKGVWLMFGWLVGWLVGILLALAAVWLVFGLFVLNIGNQCLPKFHRQWMKMSHQKANRVGHHFLVCIGLQCFVQFLYHPFVPI